MKVYYLSITSFSDVDMGIMHHLNHDVELIYGAIIQKRNANYTKEELQDYCSQHGISFEGYQMQYNLKDPRCLATFWKVVSSIRRHNPDIIYIVSIDNIYLSILSLLLKREKTIIALHDVEFHSNTQYALPLTIARWITMQFFRHFQVFSSEQIKTFKRLYPKKRVTFIPLPLKDFGERTERSRKDIEIVQFLFFGNILHYKGLDILLEAVSGLADMKDIPDFELIIAGRSNDWNEVYEPLIKDQRRIQKHIRFIGNNEVAQFFSYADYLILPYRDATQSGPLKIAFHYNIPVIASDINSFKEEVHDRVNGYLFKSGDADDLRKTLLNVLADHQHHYERMKKAQLNYVHSNYAPSRLRHNFLEMFRKISSG